MSDPDPGSSHPDGGHQDGRPADGGTAGPGAPAIQPGSGVSPQQLAWRIWFGTGTVVGLVVAADVGYEFTLSRVYGLLLLILVILAGGVIGFCLNRWDRLGPRHRTAPAGQAGQAGEQPPPVPPGTGGGAKTGTVTAGTGTAGTGTASEPEAPSGSGRARVLWAGAVAGAALGGLFGLAYGTGDAFTHGIDWGLLATAGAVVIVTLAAVWHIWLPDPLRGLHGWLPLTVCAALTVTALTLGTVQGMAERTAACPGPTELRVLATAEDIDAIDAVIPHFEQSVTRSGCYAVDVTAYAAPDQAEADSAFGNWEQEVKEGSPPIPDPVTGPPPDAWIPDSADEIAPYDSGHVLHDMGPIGVSPLVIAVPTAAVNAHQDLAAMETETSWQLLYQTLTADGLGLAVPDPNQSEAALTGLADLYRPPFTAAEEGRIELADNFPSDSEALLCQAGQAAGQGVPQHTAYLVTEAAVASYNAGRLGGQACAQPAQPLQLVPFYPAPPAALTFDFVTVNWPRGQSPAARSAAVEFYHWLRSDGDLLEHGGVRPPGCQPGGTVNTVTFGDGTKACLGAVNPPSQTEDQTLADFNTARTPAHVLIAVDDSMPMTPYLSQISAAIGTDMSGTADDSGDSVNDSRDSFAIWELPGTNGQEETTLVGLEAATASNRQQVASGLGALTGHSHSANYDVLASAAALLYGSNTSPAGAGAPTSTVVLLTDGDGYPRGDPRHNTATSVEKTFRQPPSGSKPVRLFIIAFGAAGCAQPMLQLTNATGGTCFAANQSDPVHLLRQVLDQVLDWG